MSLHGRQGAELLRLGACELVRSAFRAGERGLETALSLSYFAELLDAFAQEGEAEDAVYRLALAVVRAAEKGVPEALLALPRGLAAEAPRHLPAPRPLRGLRPRPARGRAALSPCAHGFVCDDCGPASGPFLPEGARSFLGEVFRRAPADLAGPCLRRPPRSSRSTTT